MSNINSTISLPADHWLVGALKNQAEVRLALRMLSAELLEGLMEDGDVGAREHVLGLAKRARARYGEAFEQIGSALDFPKGDPGYEGPRGDAYLAKELAELLAPDEDEEPREAP